jgi:CRP/FNR family transcriptional regulator
MDFERIESLSRELDSLQRHLHKVMSREIVRDQGAMMLLSIMNAEERVASFLANLVDRLKARGFSSSELILRMGRKDIGSHLGMTIETVSRVLSRMVQDGMITVNQRHIVIANPQRLLEKASLSRPG